MHGIHFVFWHATNVRAFGLNISGATQDAPHDRPNNNCLIIYKYNVHYMQDLNYSLLAYVLRLSSLSNDNKDWWLVVPYAFLKKFVHFVYSSPHFLHYTASSNYTL